MPDQSNPAASWETVRKRSARRARLAQRQVDDRYPELGLLVSVLADCPHGTEYGYVEFGCRCLDLGPVVHQDPTDPTSPLVPTGCRPVGVQASARRRARRIRGATTAPAELPALAQLDSEGMFATCHKS